MIAVSTVNKNNNLTREENMKRFGEFMNQVSKLSLQDQDRIALRCEGYIACLIDRKERDKLSNER